MERILARKIFTFLLLFLLLVVVLFLVAPKGAFASLPTEKQFTGHVFDQASDLYYMRARYYDPVIGRFLSPDQGGDSPNHYIYAHNNPLAFTDPMGEQGRWFHEGFKDWMLQASSGGLRQTSPIPPEFIVGETLMVMDISGFLGGAGLDIYTEQFIQEVPYNPITQRKEFVEYLSRNIHGSVLYNASLKRAWGLQREFRNQLLNIFPPETARADMNTFPGSRERPYQAIGYFALRYNMAISLERQAWEERASLSLVERYQQDKFVCSDFTVLASYGLATEVRIPTLIGVSEEPPHAFGLIKLEGEKEPYVFDVTNWEAFGGSLIPFSEYQKLLGFDAWDVLAIWEESKEEFADFLSGNY